MIQAFSLWGSHANEGKCYIQWMFIDKSIILKIARKKEMVIFLINGLDIPRIKSKI